MKRQIRKRLLLTIALVVAVIFGCSQSPGTREYERALREWAEGHLVRARASLESSIRKRPGNPANAKAFNQLGIILYQLGEQEQALLALRNSLQINSNCFNTVYNLGSLLQESGQFERAAGFLETASNLNPSNSLPWEMRATIRLRQGRWEQAYKALKEADRLAPGDPRIKNGLAIAVLQLDNPLPALKILEEILRKHPNYAPALFNLGNINYRFLEHKRQAADYFEHYLRSSPEGIYAPAAEQALEHIEKGLSPSAVDSIFSRAEELKRNRILNYTPPATPDRVAAKKTCEKAFEHFAKGRKREAIEWYTRTIELDDTYRSAFYNLAVAYQDIGNLKAAQEAYRRAVELNPASPRERYALAFILYKRHKPEQSEKQLQIILNKHPDYTQAIELLRQIRNP